MLRVRIDPSSRLPVEEPVIHEPFQELAAPFLQAGSRFVELCARTHFSFLAGGSSPDAVVDRAANLGLDTLGIADIHGIYGMVRVWEAAKARGIRLVVGCEVLVGDEHEATALALHVASREGYTHLCELLTEAHRNSRTSTGEKRTPYVTIAMLVGRTQGLWATILGAPELIQPANHSQTKPLFDLFGSRLSLALTIHKDGEDRARLAAALQESRRFGIPLLATNRPRFAVPEDRVLYDVLRCIQQRTTLDAAGRTLLPNAEAHLKGEAAMEALFANYPEAIARTRRVADACLFSLAELKYHFPCRLAAEEVKEDDQGQMVPMSANEALAFRVEKGLVKRYGMAIPSSVRALVRKELGVIAHIDVAPYFLSVHDIVELARARDILCQGRGSAANSAVCWALGITAVDPARSSMLFERFLSPERKEPPDIDVDFEHERREEVIQEIYQRYGRTCAAMVSEVVCYRGRSALREVAKVFGLSLEQTDRLAGIPSYWDSPESASEERLREAGFDPQDPRIEAIVRIAHAMQGFPRHISIHVGGFILSAEPLSQVAPVEPAGMKDRTIVPWDKDDIDVLGFFKLDVLALGMLTALRKGLDFIKEPGDLRGANERLAQIPAEDPVVYDALCRADSVGVFQIESRAQMSMLPRLRPRNFYDLVVQVAIVRPGPIQGGMVHPYLRRRSGEEASDAPHPILAPVLERTLGVPLFQEQVMQLAIVGAGYSGGEADQLRRDMAAWKKTGRLARHRDRLYRGFVRHGISPEFCERLWKQIHGFGEYGFPESHAASFALLVYASAWLKTHHPAAFAAALINSQPMGFYSPSTILQDAKRHGVEVLPLCVFQSGWDCALESASPSARGGPAIRLGLRLVKGLGAETVARLVAARGEQLLSSVEELKIAANLSAGDLEKLAEAGALEALVGKARRRGLWEARKPVAERLFLRANVATAATKPLLKDAVPASTSVSVPGLTRAEQLALDYERTGVSVQDHPLRVLRERLPRDVWTSAALAAHPNLHGTTIRIAGMVLVRQRPQTASGVVFMTLEDEFGFFNLVLWAATYERLRHVATSYPLVLVCARVEIADRETASSAPIIHLVVHAMEPLETEGIVATPSRDFH